MGPRHLPGMRPMSFEQELPAGETIQDQTTQQPPPRPAIVKVLGEHDEAVAEVEVGLARTAIAQRPATDVVDHGATGVADVPAHAPQTPAQVDVLHVREQRFVEPLRLVEGFGPHEEAGARGPENLPLIIVLPMVLLGDLEDATPAEGIAVPIDEAARRARMFETPTVALAEHF